MKKLLFGIFAHPDDEAFGPSAYLYRQAQEGTDVHLIVVTDGDAGRNEGYEDLAAKRVEEWLESGRRIGAVSNKALHYPDGGLDNNLYLKIAGEILEYINEVLDTYKDRLEIEFVTFEQRGISGHLDHIAVSFIATYVYEKLKQEDRKHVTFTRLLYYCLPSKMMKTSSVDWLYMPKGYEPSEVDFVHPYNDIIDKKLHIMRAHESQKHDMENVMAAHEAGAKDGEYADHFLVHH